MEDSGTGSVIDPLLRIERDGLSGILAFCAQGIRTNIYARAGEIVFADAGTVGETLGRTLIRAGRMTEEQVAAVIRRMTDALVDNEHVRFGEVVVDYGFLTAGELDFALVEQVRTKIIGCVYRGDGAWRFSRDDPRVGEVGAFVVSTRPMLVEAAALFPERRTEAVLELDHERYPELAAPAGIIANAFDLSSEQSTLLAELDGGSSVQAVLATREGAAPLLAALVLGGGVVLRVAPPSAHATRAPTTIPPPFRSGRPARLTPSPSAPGAEPASGAPAATGPERSARARAALARLKADLDRHRALAQAQARPLPEPTDEKERRLMAASAFHLGRTALRAEDFARALPHLQRAHELLPEEREYALYARWAQVKLDGALSDPAARAEIRTMARLLVLEIRECELGLHVLGHCALFEGNERTALRYFQRAAALDPKLVDAARHARLLAMRTSGKRAT